MSSLMETVSILNSAIRTLLAVVLVGGLGYGGWYGYSVYNSQEIEAQRAVKELAEAKSELSRANVQLEEKNQELAEKAVEIGRLNVQVEEQGQEIQRLDTSLRLLKVDHRVARLKVLDQAKDEETGQLYSLVQFQELDERGQPIDNPREFRIKGDMVYVEGWVVKFDDKYVEQADIERSTSLFLFRRIFGELQQPQEGFPLDQEGSRPAAYARGQRMSDFEKRIWDDFWNVANDKDKQDELGIRAAHGDAASMKIQKGKTYRIDLRSSDGPSIKPDDSPLPSEPAA